MQEQPLGVPATLSVSDFTLIRSKLLVPNPAGLLHRPRVCQSIEHGLERKLTVLSAPAGYGKTSALVDFARCCSLPVCWYTADERDRDLRVFVEYLVGAVRERFPGFGEHTLSALASSAGDLFRDSTGVVGDMANEILEIDTSFMLVIDNYEALDGAWGIRTFIQRLLEVLPPDCHLMLGSRVLPEVPVTHLVAKRQLVGLAARDLSFTPQEVQDLLQRSRIEVTQAQAEAMAASSEGWITGVLLLADLLREDTQAILFSEERATAETYSYLAADVLIRQPPDVRQFLRTSSILREMSSRSCREILQVREAGTLLSELERRNLFVTRFGTGGAATYRYHNLFRDFLQRQLEQRSLAAYNELHLRAARWFERKDDVEETVYHYLAAEAYPQATALMDRVTMEWFTRGREETLLRWAEKLPEAIRAQAPRLALYHSRVLTERYKYTAAREALIHAETGFAAQEDTARQGWVHIQRAALALLEGHYENAILDAQAALEILTQREIGVEAEAARLIGKAYIGLGRFADAMVYLQNALDLFRQAGSPYDVMNALQGLMVAFTDRGELDRAASYASETLVIARRLGALGQLAGALNNLGWLHYLRGEYREALASYEEGLVAAQRGGNLRWQAYISAGMADLYRDVGAYERAGSLYDAAWRLARESEFGLAIQVLGAQADMYRWQGEVARTLALLEEANQLASERGLEFESRGAIPISKGIAVVESGEAEQGLDLLNDGICFLAGREAKRELARAEFLRAKAHFVAGERAQAVASLRQMVDLAQEIGTYQFAVVEGQHAEDLLGLGVAEGITACRDIIAGIQRLRGFAEGRVSVETNDDAARYLEVYALGGGQVVHDGHALSSSEWQAAMVKELFFYIVLNGPLGRDAIGLIFWPDLSAKSVTSNFHNALYRMRRAVGAEAIVVEDGKYRLGNVDYWFDVEEFEALVERARLLPPSDWQVESLWRRALALYRGDFLPEVERMWCVPKREALRGMYVEALLGVGQCREMRGEFEEAISWYRRALEADDLREDVYRHIMQCYKKAGRRPEALAQYRRCCQILRQELGVDPSIETRDLYRQIVGERIG